ncbi:tail sheath stabilizer and completion protein [Porticoccaceae bacterium]|nr:tail sheath stabilizer and completion protein [Porticoccaceae bacterium]
MFGGHFYHGAIRKYIIMFGSMFNDIDVVRYDKQGNRVQGIRVPIAYGPKEKFLARLNQDPGLDRQVATQLPRMSFEVTDMAYSPTRTLNKMQRNTSLNGGSNNTMRSQFTPVPYDISITLSAMFANNEDAVQVVEQILPYFRPEFTHSVKLVPEIEQYYDIPTVLQGMTIEDTYEADFQTRRAIIYSFNFVVKGYIFGPVSNKGTIKRTVVDFNIPSGDTLVNAAEGPNKRLVLTPGLLANGSPTSISADSVSAGSISANSDYGFAFDSEDFFDGETR